MVSTTQLLMYIGIALLIYYPSIVLIFFPEKLDSLFRIKNKENWADLPEEEEEEEEDFIAKPLFEKKDDALALEEQLTKGNEKQIVPAVIANEEIEEADRDHADFASSILGMYGNEYEPATPVVSDFSEGDTDFEGVTDFRPDSISDEDLATLSGITIDESDAVYPSSPDSENLTNEQPSNKTVRKKTKAPKTSGAEVDPSQSDTISAYELDEFLNLDLSESQ